MIPRPMKPCRWEEWQPKAIPVSYYIQPKYDGLRILVSDGVAYSANGKPIPNQALQRRLAPFHGLDGELMLSDFGDGEPHDFHQLSGIVRQRDHHASDVVCIVFDWWNLTGLSYRQRFAKLKEVPHSDAWVELGIFPALTYGPCVIATVSPSLKLYMEGQVRPLLEIYLKAGYEGLILRDADATYKHGRSTSTESRLVKWKPFTVANATIIGYELLRRNYNPQKRDAFGLAQRSSTKGNTSEEACIGAFLCTARGFEPFKVGTGFTELDRHRLYAERDDLVGRPIRFKYLTVGTEARPRHPVFLGFIEVV